MKLKDLKGFPEKADDRYSYKNLIYNQALKEIGEIEIDEKQLTKSKGGRDV